MAGKVANNLVDETFENWYIKEYIGKSKYIGKCKLCGREKVLNAYFLNKGQIVKCECQKDKKPSIKAGDKFGDWEVIEQSDRNGYYKCRCTCGKCNNTVRDVLATSLKSGKSRGCGANSNKKLDDLTDRRFGDWLVIEKGPTGKYGETCWLCECQCDLHTRKLVKASTLKSGASKSCGHSTTGLKDLTGMQFNNWKVIRYCGIINNRTMWECECQCEKHTRKILDSYVLRNGISKSCGCLTDELRKQTNIEKYGVKFDSQIGTTRSKEQLEAIESKQSLTKFIHKHFGDIKPTTTELGSKLGLDRTSTMMHIHKFELEEIISIGGLNTSTQEREIGNMFPTDYKNNRSILDGKEIDFYYPEYKLGIEFNGSYWHSEVKKDKMYHQMKTILAAKKNIRLIHIFEYEWEDKDTKNKLIKLIDNVLNDKRQTIYARNCELRKVDKSEAKQFIEKYHLQGYTDSDIRIGLYYMNELVEIITFGKPRFDNEYEYELIRLVSNSDYKIVGGTEKMLKHFVEMYNPRNIISYCDASKFSGEVYSRLGFKLVGITQPNYKWVGYDTYKVLSRYQTQKHHLVELGLGTEDQTEAEIMHNLGYLRVYDCGNYKFIWEKNSNTEHKE